MTEAVTAAASSPAATARPQSSLAAGQLQADYQSFLKLLTAQISNQDPLAPMESTEFVSQLAQLSQVEQSVKTNSHLETIAAAMRNQTAMVDMGLIGRDVTLPGDRFVLGEAPARLGYSLADPAATVTLLIRDASGAPVRQIAGPSGAADGRVTIAWDGTDSAGNPLPPGLYIVEAAAADAAGEPVAAATWVEARVESVALDSGGSVLTLGNGTTASTGTIAAIR